MQKKVESTESDHQARAAINKQLKEKAEQPIEPHQPEEQENEADMESDENPQQQSEEQQSQQPGENKRKRPADQQQHLEHAEQTEEIVYLTFSKGDRIVTRQTFDNGWWYGNVLKKPDVLGYFPSNYVKVGTPAPLPETTPEIEEKSDWIQEEMKKLGGPVKSQYYQGITGYKMVKIDDKNKNILKGNYVKYDVASGLAKVPIKSQDPTAKAVRQMGYYFDYHEWCEQKNANPTPKSRPDPRKKRKKRLNLILFGEDKIKRKPKAQ